MNNDCEDCEIFMFIDKVEYLEIYYEYLKMCTLNSHVCGEILQ